MVSLLETLNLFLKLSWLTPIQHPVHRVGRLLLRLVMQGMSASRLVEPNRVFISFWGGSRSSWLRRLSCLGTLVIVWARFLIRSSACSFTIWRLVIIRVSSHLTLSSLNGPALGHHGASHYYINGAWLSLSSLRHFVHHVVVHIVVRIFVCF